jgi:antitoxin component of MazEF toxin-antitoxin module
MAKNKVITPDMVDWNAYRRSVEASISNERLWCTEFSRENIANLEDELVMIDNEEFEELFSKYDDDVWRDYLK